MAGNAGLPPGLPRARALGRALRNARERKDISLRKLAAQLELSHVNISQWESGERVPKIETVAMILTALEVPADEREHVLDLARNATEPNWVTVGMNGIPQQLAGVVECERAASTITNWSPMIVPGLLQTTEYARSVKQTGGDLSRNDVELRVMVTASRDEVITRRKDPVNFVGLIGEAALHDSIGEDGVMEEQLARLVEMAERPNITLRIVPLGIGWHPGLAGPFVLYEFPDGDPVVYFEHHSSGAFIPTKHDVTAYQQAAAWITEISMSPADSLKEMSAIMKGKQAS